MVALSIVLLGNTKFGQSYTRPVGASFQILRFCKECAKNCINTALISRKPSQECTLPYFEGGIAVEHIHLYLIIISLQINKKKMYSYFVNGPFK